MAKIFLDPGHGGAETGAVNKAALEKDINLIVALEVRRILELNNQTVVMSRDSDVYVSLTDRCNKANAVAADCFVSIHHNANDGASKDGEVYCSINGGTGELLANYVDDEFTAIGQPTRVLTRESEKYPGTDYYTVIGSTKMPAIITEFGYMDNSKDYIQFDTVDELLTEALAIAKAILKFVGVGTIVTSAVVEKHHWAQGAFDYLVSKGVKINETRFDDNITRGEAMALLAQVLHACKD